MKRERSLLAIILMFGFFLAAWGGGQALAQNVGSIYGEVVDSTGAVVADATVTILSLNRGITRTVKSNATGQYNLTNLQPDEYLLTATAPKFKDFKTQVVVDADNNVKVTCAMEVGIQGEVVEVKSEAVISGIDTHSGQLGMIVDERIAQDIPLTDRTVVGIAQTLPGVADVNAPTTFTGDRSGPTFSTSGSRTMNNLFLFDGVIFNNLFRNTGLNYPGQDAVKEVSVLLNNLGPEYGRNSGAVMNVITKSGTNQLHGSLWEFHRNGALNAINWYQGYNSYPNTPQRPKLVNNQFGAAVGGPIKKDKLFVFGAYQGYRIVQQIIDTGSVTPSAQELYPTYDSKLKMNTVDFSDLWRNNYRHDKPGDGDCDGSNKQSPDDPWNTGSNCLNKFLRNPITNSQMQMGYNRAILERYNPQCAKDLDSIESLIPSLVSSDKSAGTFAGYLPYGKLPGSCVNPIMKKIIEKWVPLNPNGGHTNTTTGQQPQTDDNGLLRIDYTLGRHQIDGRMNIANADDFVPPSGGTAITTYEPTVNWARMIFSGINDTMVVNSNLVNVFRIGFRNFTTYTYPTDPTTLSDLGATGFPVFGGSSALPAVTAGSVLTLGGLGNIWSKYINKSFEANDTLSWTKGKHVIQFGGTYLRLRYRSVTDRGTQGLLHFSTSGGTHETIADIVMGLTSGTSSANPAIGVYTSRYSQGGNQSNVFLFAKDDFRITPRLTLNLGVRYELPFPWTEPNNYWGTFAPGVQSVKIPNAPTGMVFPGDPNVPNGIIPTQTKEIMPRVGFSYDLFGDGKTALRGGFGIFYNAMNANVIQNTNQPWACWFYSQQYPSYVSAPLDAANITWGYCDPKRPTFIGVQRLNYLSPRFKPSQSMNFNLGIAQQLPQNVNLEINYVGRLGRHDLVSYEANPAIYIPGVANSGNTDYRRLYYGFGDNTIIDSPGTSNYNALQVIASKRATKYLRFNSSYTWSRSIDLNSAEYNGTLTEEGRIPNVWDLSTERAASDFNSTHIFNLSWVLDLPKVKSGNGFLRGLANGWSYGGMYAARSGRPVNVNMGSNDSALSGTNNQRFVMVGDWRMPNDRSTLDKVNAWFNNVGCTVTVTNPDGTKQTNEVNYPTPCDSGAAFEKPALGTFGTGPRNSVTGPGRQETNMYINRNFKLPYREGMQLQFRFEALGVFNHVQLGQPTAGSGSNFGRITRASGERNLRFSLRLKF